jgi:hypothetical protein
MTGVRHIASLTLVVAASFGVAEGTRDGLGNAAPPGGAASQPRPELSNEARRRLARHLKVAESALTLQTTRAELWRDSALGCPSPGTSYLTVITPGFVLVFETGGQSYAVHADESGKTFVLCAEGRPTALEESPAGSPPKRGAPMTSAEQTAATRAREALARELRTNADDIKVIEVAATEWRDSALGCPKPGVSYLQVITPGYRIALEWMGKRYEYHSDRQGNVVRCE